MIKREKGNRCVKAANNGWKDEFKITGKIWQKRTTQRCWFWWAAFSKKIKIWLNVSARDSQKRAKELKQKKICHWRRLQSNKKRCSSATQSSSSTIRRNSALSEQQRMVFRKYYWNCPLSLLTTRKNPQFPWLPSIFWTSNLHLSMNK